MGYQKDADAHVVGDSITRRFAGFALASEFFWHAGGSSHFALPLLHHFLLAVHNFTVGIMIPQP